mgnify:CR=1 FL=1
MRTAVHITIDTESSMGGAWAYPDRRPLPASRHVFCETPEGALGIPLICDELERRGMRGTFFVETLAGLVLGEDDTRQVTDFLLGRGQDVQLHIHPTFRHYRDHLRAVDAGTAEDEPWECDQVSGHDEETQLDLLRDAARLFERATGHVPRAFRSGGFAADRRTLRCLRRIGIGIDSSYNPIYRHSNASFPDDPPPATNQVARSEAVWELPITVGRTGLAEGVGRTHTDVTSISNAEMERILEAAHAGGMRHVVTIFHCFSTVKPRDIFYSRLRPNRVVIRRLQRFLDYLQRNEDRFEVVTFGDLADEPGRLAGEHPAVIPDLGVWHPAARKVVQAVNNAYWV